MSKSSPMLKNRSRITYMASSLGPIASSGSATGARRTTARLGAVGLRLVTVPSRRDRARVFVHGFPLEDTEPRRTRSVGHPPVLLIGARWLRDAAAGTEQGLGEPGTAGAQLVGGDVEVGLSHPHGILVGAGQCRGHDGSADELAEVGGSRSVGGGDR